MITLRNQTILVVGGTSGIGFSVAKTSLLSLAAKVIVASSSEAKVARAIERLKTVISEQKLPGIVEGGTLDASNIDAVKTFVLGVGEIDHLVWTSGDPIKPSSLDVDLKESKNILNVRYWGAVAAVQAAKIHPGGSVVLTTGSGIFKPPKQRSIIIGAGGAVDAVVRGLAIDIAPIRVNSVCPGLIDTEMFQGLPKERRDAFFETTVKRLPVEHIGTPDECAEAYIFLMKCGYITGQRIIVDGGTLLM